jgi:hypothetical protein
LIGQGLFGKTYKYSKDSTTNFHKNFKTFYYRAEWHGQMAVKELELDPSISYTSEKYRLFKKEIFNLIKTRHGNLILFVGACMEPPRLAIVMRF